MNAYLFSFRRGEMLDFHEIIEWAYTAEDALTQFRVNVIENPNNQRRLHNSKWISEITLWSMETLPENDPRARRG